MRIRANHGVLPQERVVGADFLVSIRVECTPMSSATDSDQLAGTISYADLSEIITDQMRVPSQLLEHVATRITRAVFAQCQLAEHIWLRITKVNPPMGADCQGAGVELSIKK